MTSLRRMTFWRRFAAFSGPGYLVAVGYMDPGNWATDIAGGAGYGYALLSMVLAASLMAMLLQALSARLGIAAGLDLAKACRRKFSRSTTITLWILSEIAIIACDLAEVIGTALALKMLFGLPLVVGVCLTTFDVLLLLLLQHRGMRLLETFVVVLIAAVFICFAVEIFLARPEWEAVALGLFPRPALLADPAALYVAIGILGATVMPHNLYLHSAVVQTRVVGKSPGEKTRALRYAVLDSTVALTVAFFINAAILTLAGAVFHRAGATQISELDQAYRLLSPMLGASAASLLFGVALLASGQNSTITGTLAGQIVMEGFVALRLSAWARRLTTRALAVVPAAIVASLFGGTGVTQLLILSQIILSLQLPFAMLPLVSLTADQALMGRFATRGLLRFSAWTVATIITGLNLFLLWMLARGNV